MTRLLLLLLLALVLGAAAAVYLRAETGYVLVSYGAWVLETSLLGLAAAVMALLLGGYYTLQLLTSAIRLPGAVRQVFSARRLRRAQSSFDAGLRLLLEARWDRAETELVRRAADYPTPALNYLLAARAAQQGGSHARARKYLSLAAQYDDDGAFTPVLVRAELMLERGELAGAIRELQMLHMQDPQHRAVVARLAEAYVRSAAWEPLRRLLSGKAGQLLPAVTTRRLLRQALRERMLLAAKQGRLDALKSAWNDTPGELRGDAALQLSYVRGLAQIGAESEAAAHIVKALKQGWDEALVAVYGGLDGLDPVTQLASVESWLTQFGEQPTLLLIAGRVCRRNQLWGKAQSYLEGVQRDHPSATACLELAQLCEDMKRPEDAQAYYRQGLKLAATAE